MIEAFLKIPLHVTCCAIVTRSMGVSSQRIRSMSIEEVLSAPASPWQRAYVERLIGSIRRDCLDHVIVLGEGHLRKILKKAIGSIITAAKLT